MATKRSTAAERAEDRFWVFNTLLLFLNDAYNSKPDSERHLGVFRAGLQADPIERAYRRILRERPHLTSGQYCEEAWVRLPEILRCGREQVAEYREQERQRGNGGTP